MKYKPLLIPKEDTRFLCGYEGIHGSSDPIHIKPGYETPIKLIELGVRITEDSSNIPTDYEIENAHRIPGTEEPDTPRTNISLIDPNDLGDLTREQISKLFDKRDHPSMQPL